VLPPRRCRKARLCARLHQPGIDLAPRNSDAHCLLSTILMELGRFHEAAASSDVALALNRRQITAYHELVHVKKLTEADRPLIAQMEWVLKECNLADDEQADLHSRSGKVTTISANIRRRSSISIWETG
jgi:hypothetical protein